MKESFIEQLGDFSWSDIVGVPKEIRRKGRTEKKIFEEIMARDFSNLMKTVNSGIQESQQTPSAQIYTKMHHNQIAQKQ